PHAVWGCKRNGDGSDSLGRRAIAPREPPQRHPPLPGLEIPQRAVKRVACSAGIEQFLDRGAGLYDVHAGQMRHHAQYCIAASGGTLAAIIDRCPLAASNDPLTLDFGHNEVDMILRAACNHELARDRPALDPRAFQLDGHRRTVMLCAMPGKSLSERVAEFGHRLAVEAHAAWFAARDPRTPALARLLAVAVAAYALSPVDLIPDFIPVLGWLDDLILVPAGLWAVRQLIPTPLWAELHRAAEAASERP